MKRYTQFHELVVNDFETDSWEHPVHKHNHFELIFIDKGSGNHHLNQNLIPYEAGHLYLLGPEDEHEFIVEKRTRFIYFKFTKFYLDTTDIDHPTQWNKDIDLILKSTQRQRGNLINHEEDITSVKSLMDLIVKEYQCGELLNKKIIFQYFKALILILKRNQSPIGYRRNKTTIPSTLENLLEYIELNIYNPKMLTQKQIAKNFHISPNYIGAYFKNHFGTSLKKYIQEYRYNLLEQRIKSGQTSTKQLSYDFGFTDESHLHRFVKSVTSKSLVDLKHLTQT